MKSPSQKQKIYISVLSSENNRRKKQEKNLKTNERKPTKDF